MPGRDANELLSMPVVATAEGKELGRVKDVVFDPAEHALLGLVVSTKDGMDAVRFLERREILSIGQDAVTVGSAGVLRELDSSPRAREVVESGVHLRGASILTESGDSIGTVDKVLIDEEGDVAGYQASSGFMGFGGKTDIAPTDVVSIGQDAIVVSGAAAEPAPEDDTTPGARTNPDGSDPGGGANSVSSGRYKRGHYPD